MSNIGNALTFPFDSHTVRVQVDELGQPWFNANDVCTALEFGNARQAIESHVDPEDVQKLDTLTAGGRQSQNHVNESGLYALILGSTKDAAKRFKRWVTSEVLPAIRKTGQYATPVASPPLSLPDFTDPAAAARAWAAQFEQRKALEVQNAQQAQVLAVAVPKAVVFDDLHSRPGCMCIRDAAKQIGVGERELICKLIEKKWLYRREGADGRTGGLKASTYGLEKGYFEHYPRPGRDGELRDALLVTTKGLHRLTYNAFQVWGLAKRVK